MPYRRVGDDLLYTHTISLVDALNSIPIRLETLDGWILSIPVDQIVNPQTVETVEGEGMPIYDAEAEKNPEEWETQKKGQLFVKFNIIFRQPDKPSYLTQDQKDRIRAILK